MVPTFVFVILGQLCVILNDAVVTGRGVWIPTTPNEAMWFGIAQWFGLESGFALNYVLPNMNNFGCRLYSEMDLYHNGTGEHNLHEIFLTFT